jgi:cell wall-associated NlpC family hydrolase
MLSTTRPGGDPEVVALQRRALAQRKRFVREMPPAAISGGEDARTGLHNLPLRFALHLSITLLVPLAMLLSRMPLTYGPSSPSTAPQTTAPLLAGLDFTAPLAPLALPGAKHEALAPDSAFAAIDALPMPVLRPELLAVRPVVASVAADEATVRGGPGTEYDQVTTLPTGAALLLVAQYGDWYKAQVGETEVAWIAAELLDADPIAAEMLPEATSIPAPPPPKIAQVLSTGLNLRDGPGTNYVGMHTLPGGAQLDLLAQYGGWFQVQTGEGRVGWVTSEFLGIGPGVVERVEVVAEIPDPNPALVGMVGQARVNLRGGPGTAYQKIGALGADVRLDLLASHKDWLKVRTPQGGEGWISRELVDVNPYVARRVPAARTIPPPPQIARRPAARGTAGVQFAPASASGGPAAFALQFVGARYAWGGSSPERGFDCSGFVRYVYGQFGVGLPHSAAGQYSSRHGAIVSDPAELVPGDLVFFVNTYKRGISHVGIYIGGGNVVQALSPGRGVGVASLSSGYWAARYYGAIRPGR